MDYFLNAKRGIVRFFLLISCFSSCLFSYELVVASMFYNEAPYLREWVEYHRMAGVDHFWLYNDNSTDNWEEVLLPYMEEGLVEVFNWPIYPSTAFINVFEKDTSLLKEPLEKDELPYVEETAIGLTSTNEGIPEANSSVESSNDTIGVVEVKPIAEETAKFLSIGSSFWSYYNFIGRQCMVFKESLKKGNGVAKWVTFIDIDEFILPMKGASIPECLDKYFSDAQAIYVNWRCFGTGGVNIPKGESLLFNLTACSLQSHPRNAVGKMIIRPECASINITPYWWECSMPYSPHFCFLKEEGIYCNGSGEKIYPIQGEDFKTDGFTHAKYLRINHYTMRDESFFSNVRLERLRSMGKIEEAELNIEHNKHFSLVKDFAMINFLKKNYPDAESKLKLDTLELNK